MTFKHLILLSEKTKFILYFKIISKISSKREYINKDVRVFYPLFRHRFYSEFAALMRKVDSY